MLPNDTLSSPALATGGNNPDLERVFRAMALPFLILTPKENAFRIDHSSEAFSKISGEEASVLEGKALREAFPKNSVYTRLLRASLQKVTQNLERDKMEVVRYDTFSSETPREKYWRPENFPILNEDGELDYILHVVTDVTTQVVTKIQDHKIEEERVKNQQKYNYFIEKNSDALYSLDVYGNFTSGNEGLASLLEVPLEEILKTCFISFCAQQDYQRSYGYFQEALSGETCKFEAGFVTGKGKELSMDISFLPMYIEGNIIGVYGVAKDRSLIQKTQKRVEKKANLLKANATFIGALVENKLEENALEQTFEVLGRAIDVDRMYYFENIPDEKIGQSRLRQKVRWTRKTDRTLKNPRTRDFTKEQTQKLKDFFRENEKFTAIIKELPEGPDKVAFQKHNVQSVIFHPVFLNTEMYGFIGMDDCTHDRTWSEDEITFLRNLAHNLSSALGEKKSAATIKRQEERLKRSEQKFKALVQEGSDMLAILDPLGNYKFLSDSTTAVLGISPKEFLGRNYLSFIHPDDQKQVLEKFSALKVGERIRMEPYRLQNQYGEWRYLQTTATDLTQDPAVQGVVTNSRDITTIINLFTEVQKQNEVLKEIAWEQSHVVRAPLTRLQGLLDLLEMEPFEDISRAEIWQYIHSSADELDSIVRKIVVKTFEVEQQIVEVV